jgi:hypothetical protein
MRNLPIHYTANWIICNSIHAQCPPDYPVSGLSMHDRMLVINDKGRKLSAECSKNNGEVPCVFVYIRRAGLFT